MASEGSPFNQLKLLLVKKKFGIDRCRRPKSNENGEYYKRDRERGREWRLGFFKWFSYVSLRPHDVANGLHLYYILFMIILDDYNVL
jgi:hypothetical protein